jgi:hypothetical protein
MSKNLNDLIVKRLEERKEEILDLCSESTKEIEFSAEYDTIVEVFDVKDVDGNWVTVENPIKTQTIEIYTYEEFDKDDTKENNITVFLNDNSVSGKYFQNAGVSLEATLKIIKIIGGVKDIRQFIR